MSGLVDKAKGAMGDAFMGFLGYADKPENATARKAARIAMSTLLFAGALLIFYGMVQGAGFFHPTLSAFLNPSVMTMLGMPMFLGGAGVAFSWIIQDLIGEKHHRTAAKITAIIMPFGLLAAAGCLIAAGCHGGFTGHSFTSWFFAGALLVSGFGLTISHGYHVFKSKKNHVVDRPFDPVTQAPQVPTLHRRASHP